MEKYTRQCPDCGKEIAHKAKYSRNQSMKQNRNCQSCAAKKKGNQITNLGKYGAGLAGEQNPFFGKKHTGEAKEKMKTADKSFTQTEAYRQKMSGLTTGCKNPMYGVSVYEVWVGKYGKEKADELKAAWVEKQRVNSSGENNPMYGKPSPQGTGNGWSGWYGSFYFRSLRELAYVVDLDSTKIKWKTGEKIKIKYDNWDGKERTYRPDFVVDDQYVIEVKPAKLQSSVNVQAKKKAAEKYCAEHGLIYQMVDPKPLSQDKIRELRLSGEIKFIDRYEKLFVEKYSASV